MGEDHYAGAPTDGSAWIAGGDCELRVVRGGSWSGNPQQLRSAVRDWMPVDLGNRDNGFRVARTLTP